MFIIKLLLSLGAHTLPGNDSSNGQPLGLWLRFSGVGELLDIVFFFFKKLNYIYIHIIRLILLQRHKAAAVASPPRP